MPAAINPIINQRVIAQGVSRDATAANNGIGTGTVSNKDKPDISSCS